MTPRSQPAAARLTIAIKEASPSVHARLRSHRDIIATLARLERIDERPIAGVHGAIQLVLPEATLVLPLAGVIDPAAEGARLRKEIDKLADEIGKIDRKLENPAFLAKADPAVVEDQRERRSEAEAARGRLAIALERVQAI